MRIAGVLVLEVPASTVHTQTTSSAHVRTTGNGLTVDEGGTRRSTRSRVRPLQYWRGEAKTYNRAHNSKAKRVLAVTLAVCRFHGPSPREPVSADSVGPHFPVPAALPTIKAIKMRTPEPKWPRPTSAHEKAKRKARTKQAAGLDAEAQEA